MIGSRQWSPSDAAEGVIAHRANRVRADQERGGRPCASPRMTRPSERTGTMLGFGGPGMVGFCFVDRPILLDWPDRSAPWPSPGEAESEEQALGRCVAIGDRRTDLGERCRRPRARRPRRVPPRPGSPDRREGMCPVPLSQVRVWIAEQAAAMRRGRQLPNTRRHSSPMTCRHVRSRAGR